jgi:hypothetical protein
VSVCGGVAWQVLPTILQYPASLMFVLDADGLTLLGDLAAFLVNFRRQQVGPRLLTDCSNGFL